VRWLKMLLVLLLCLVILFVGITFATVNEARVSIDLIFMQLPERSISLWLIAFFVSGGVCGTFLTTFAVLSLKARLSLANRKVAAITRQLEAFRSNSA